MTTSDGKEKFHFPWKVRDLRMWVLTDKVIFDLKNTTIRLNKPYNWEEKDFLIDWLYILKLQSHSNKSAAKLSA